MNNGRAWYNENDPRAAGWLRELIRRGLIADGVVDERDIRDVRPSELEGFTQCHFFAGIGVWSYALRLAAVPDSTPIWTGSCPCQPFSAAGRKLGSADERHLWPHWFHLIEQCKPRLVFGEQVASKDGLAWLDLVHADLEGEGYAVGAADLCAAGVGAPHIRQRLYFVAQLVAHAEKRGYGQHERNSGTVARPRRQGQSQEPESRRAASPVRNCGEDGSVADTRRERRQQERRSAFGNEGQDGRGSHRNHVAAGHGEDGSVADDETRRRGEVDSFIRGGDGRVRAQGGQRLDSGGELGSVAYDDDEGRAIGSAARLHGEGEPRDDVVRCGEVGVVGDDDDAGLEGYGRDGDDTCGRTLEARSAAEAGATRGYWGDADWIWCRDEKYRPVEPGAFPLAHGAPARVVRLRGYGNAIVAPLAAEFVKAYFDVAAINGRAANE